jgi:hypothetical protein
MDSFDSNDLRGEAPGENDQALWELLGRARRIEASPYFARKVLREVESAPEPVTWWQFFLRTIAPTAICAGIAVMALAGSGTKSQVVAANSDLEFETIQNLDLLVSNHESSIWLDPSSSSH